MEQIKHLHWLRFILLLILLLDLGGFLFRPILGTLFVAFSATLGACIIFLAAKTALHDLLQRKTGWTMVKKNVREFSKRCYQLHAIWLINEDKLP